MKERSSNQRLKKLFTLFLAIVLGLQVCVMPVQAASQSNDIELSRGGGRRHSGI